MNDEMLDTLLIDVADRVGRIPVDAPSEASHSEAPRRKRRWTMSAVAVASVAAVVAGSLVLGGSRPLKPRPTGRSNPGRPLAASLRRLSAFTPVDTAATPKGWVPIAYGNVQVSVPSHWLVQVAGTEVCGPGGWSTILVGESISVAASLGCKRPAGVVAIRTLHSRAPSGQRHEHNGVETVSWETSGRGGSIYHAAALGMEVTAVGVDARRIVETLTRSPLFVVEHDRPPSTPVRWQQVTFAGIRFEVPPGWHVSHENFVPCGFNLSPHSLTLGVLTRSSAESCPAPFAGASGQTGAPALAVDTGPYALRSSRLQRDCIARGELRICIGSPYWTGSPYYDTQLLAAIVYRVDGHTRQPLAEMALGLYGTGLTPLRILDSMQPAS